VKAYVGPLYCVHTTVIHMLPPISITLMVILTDICQAPPLLVIVAMPDNGGKCTTLVIFETMGP